MLHLFQTQDEGLRVQVPQLQVWAELGLLRVLRAHANVALCALQPQHPQPHPTVRLAAFGFVCCDCLRSSKKVDF